MLNYTNLVLVLRKNFPRWVDGSAENKANSAPLELELGLSLAKEPSIGVLVSSIRSISVFLTSHSTFN